MLRLALKISLAILVLGVVSFTGLFLYIWPQLPDIEKLKDVRFKTPLRIYSTDGSFIQEFGETRGVPLTIDQVPPTLIKAVLATEDTRFYQHPGVDIRGVARAAWGIIKTGSRSQGGASTITMQVAGGYFLDRSEITIDRKVREAFLSIKIERELTKDEILELYLNTNYLGHRAYGVGAAAQVYYGKSIGELTLPQYAMIAGLFQRPGKVNPVVDAEASLNRRNHVLRRMYSVGFITEEDFNNAIETPVIARSHQPQVELDAPYIAEMVRREIETLYGEDAINDGFKVYTTVHDGNQLAANNALRKALLDYDKRHGYRGPESHLELGEEPDVRTIEEFLSTFSIVNDLIPAMITELKEDSVIAQISEFGTVEIPWDGISWARRYINEDRRGSAPRSPEDIFAAGDIVRVQENENGEWTLSQIPVVEGALVSIDPNNGATLALVGGFDFFRNQWNHVTQAERQPGSSFKPFIYSAALEHGYTAATIINDVPFCQPSGIEEDDFWCPQNSSGKSYGPTRLRRAITRSLNQVSVKLVNEIGVKNILPHLAKFGFDPAGLPHNQTIALGSADLTPWQMARAYIVLANGGYRIEPYFIERVVDYRGNVIYQHVPEIICDDCETEKEQAVAPEDMPEPDEMQPDYDPEFKLPAIEGPAPQVKYAERVIDPRNAWIVNSLTHSVIYDPGGTGRKAQQLNRNDLSGKTGTSDEQRNAWFAGYNPSIIAIAWVGFGDYSRLGRGEYGDKAALPMWIDYMRIALKDVPEVTIPQPPGITNVMIDPRTGLRTTADTPGAFFEVFREEYAPPENIEDNIETPYTDGGKEYEVPNPF